MFLHRGWFCGNSLRIDRWATFYHDFMRTCTHHVDFAFFFICRCSCWGSVMTPFGTVLNGTSRVNTAGVTQERFLRPPSAVLALVYRVKDSVVPFSRRLFSFSRNYYRWTLFWHIVTKHPGSCDCIDMRTQVPNVVKTARVPTESPDV